MSYELNKERYHDMDKLRTFVLISACDIEIPILKEDYKYFINDDDYKKLVEDVEDNICSIYGDNPLVVHFKQNLHLSFIPDYINNCFFMGYSPETIVNNILTVLATGKKIKLDYSNPIDMGYKTVEVKKILEEYISNLNERINSIESELNECFNSSEFKKITHKLESITHFRDFAKASLDNIDKIFALYNYRRLTGYTVSRVEETKSKKQKTVTDFHIKWRNLANYIACVSLKIFEETGNSLYLEYPYKFYSKCTCPDAKGDQMEYVDSLCLEYDFFDSNFKNFNGKFRRLTTRRPQAIEFLLGYKDNNEFEVKDVLNPGSYEISYGNLASFITYKTRNNNPKKTNTSARAERDLKGKKEFYGEGSPFSEFVYKRFYQKGDSKTGYVGFILKNDYVVLDKFFDELQDGTCRPAVDSGVYALPLDLYDKLGRNSGKIRKYRRENPGTQLVIKKNHTESNEYQDALMELTKRESISLLKARDFVVHNGGSVPKTKTKKPKKSNNNNKKQG